MCLHCTHVQIMGFIDCLCVNTKSGRELIDYLVLEILSFCIWISTRLSVTTISVLCVLCLYLNCVIPYIDLLSWYKNKRYGIIANKTAIHHRSNDIGVNNDGPPFPSPIKSYSILSAIKDFNSKQKNKYDRLSKPTTTCFYTLFICCGVTPAPVKKSSYKHVKPVHILYT